MDDQHGGAAWQAPRARGLFALTFLLLLPAAFAPDARAAEAAGRVISSVGAVHATDAQGDERRLARDDEVLAGDTLTLGERAHAQIRMRDDALLDLESGSRFALERYIESPDGGSVVMRLLRGAMRTITGAIGDAPEDSYRVDTPVATIGIRGTQYALHHCGAGCANEGRAAGLYGRVDDGAVSASNDAASRVFRKKDYFYVAAIDTPPRAIVRPPEGILDGGAVSSGALADDSVHTVDATIDGTTELLGDTVEGSTGVLGDTAAGVGDLASGALDGDTDLETTLGDTGDLADDTLDDTREFADDTLDGGTDTLNDTVDDTTNLLGGD